MTNEFLDRIDEFFDIMETLRVAYYENIQLRQENKELKERLDEHHKQIMRMAEMSEQGTRNWINAILEGKIKLTGK
jgi:regulator of replication initiation timing